VMHMKKMGLIIRLKAVEHMCEYIQIHSAVTHIRTKKSADDVYKMGDLILKNKEINK